MISPRYGFISLMILVVVAVVVFVYTDQPTTTAASVTPLDTVGVAYKDGYIDTLIAPIIDISYIPVQNSNGEIGGIFITIHNERNSEFKYLEMSHLDSMWYIANIGVR